MPALSELTMLTAMTRRALVEAEEAAKKKKSGGVKDAKPSEDLPGDCLKAANGFRDAIKGGDKLEAAAEEIAKLSKSISTAVDTIEVKRAAMDVEQAAVKMKQAVDSIYGPFAEARQAFYSVALAWDLYEKQSSQGKKKSSSEVTALSDKELADQVIFAAKNLQTNTRDFLEKGSKASNLFRDAAKKMGLEKGELDSSQKKALIDAAFAARTAADPLFGRTQGIARRVSELLARVAQKEKFEAKRPKRVVIALAVEDDPEFGGLDLI